MKNLIIMFIIFAMSPVSVSAKEKDVSIFFVNGINNTELEAMESSYILEKKVRDKLPDGIDVIFDSVHNPGELCYPVDNYTSTTLLGNLFEIFIQNTTEDVALFWSWSNDESVPPDWFQNKTIELISSTIDSADCINDEVFEEHMLIYEKEIVEKGREIIVVSHSQGNFYANRAYNLVSSDDFNIVAVATPSDYVAGGGEHVTLTDDWVINRVRDFSSLQVLESNTTNGTSDFDITGHKFIKSYLNGNVSEEKIVCSVLGLIEGEGCYFKKVVGTVDIEEGDVGNITIADGYAYVTNHATGFISVIRLSDRMIMEDIQFGPSHDIAIADGYAYVTGPGANHVSVIRLSDGAHVDDVLVGHDVYSAEHIAIADGYAYVVVGNGISVIRLSDRTVINAIEDIGAPSHIAIADGYAYVTDVAVGFISVIRLSDLAIIDTVDVGGFLEYIAIADGYAYVTNTLAGGFISVIDLSSRTIRGTIGIDDYNNIAIADGYAYVTNYHDDSVSVVRLSDRTIIDTIDVGDSPTSIATANGHAYVVNSGDNSVTILSY